MASMRLASWKLAKYILSLNQASTSRSIRRTDAWLRSAASASCCNLVVLGHGIRLRSQAHTMPCDCPVEESEHPCSDVSHRENSTAHPKGMSLMTQPEVQNFVYRLYVVSQNSFKRLSPWDWERKTIHIAVMDRCLCNSVHNSQMSP